MQTKIKREELFRHLADTMYMLAGYDVTFDEIVKIEDWNVRFTITPSVYASFRSYAIPYIKRKLNIPLNSANRVFDVFDLEYGLRVVSNTPVLIDNA
jgi:hypothetical protein